MRLALISDIHANLAAFRAVLDDLPGTDLIICCGDIVGYYDEPNEVCALARERGVLCIRGNHDAYVTGALAPNPERREAYRTDWTRGALEIEHLGWLERLPTEIRLEAKGHRLWVRHASPWDEESYLYADAAESLARLQISPGETLAVGHTHHPLHLRSSGGWLLNPGSVGQPRDRDPRAGYALLDLETNAVSFHRVPYDVPSVQHRLAARGWSQDMIAILSRTR